MSQPPLTAIMCHVTNGPLLLRVHYPLMFTSQLFHAVLKTYSPNEGISKKKVHQLQLPLKSILVVY